MRIIGFGLIISLLVGNTNAAVAHSPSIDHEVRLTSTTQVISDGEEIPHKGGGRR